MQIKGPVRAILYTHKAIKAELATLRDAAEKLELNANFDQIGEKVEFLHDAVSAHAAGEEAAFYPAADELRRDISQVYQWEHKVDEEYFKNIKGYIASLRNDGRPPDLREIKRNVYALHATLSTHAQKEDDLLVPLIDSELEPLRQGEMVGKIVAAVPPELMEKVFKWIVGAISTAERADYLGIVKKGAPPERFQVMVGWVRQVLPGDQWQELVAAMPELQG